MDEIKEIEEKWEKEWREWHSKCPQIGYSKLISLNSYLQARQKGQEEIELLLVRVKELEAQPNLSSGKITCNNLICYTEKLQCERRMRELEEGIEKHKSNNYKRISHPMTDDDLILYKLVEYPAPAQARGTAGRKEE